MRQSNAPVKFDWARVCSRCGWQEVHRQKLGSYCVYCFFVHTTIFIDVVLVAVIVAVVNHCIISWSFHWYIGKGVNAN